MAPVLLALLLAMPMSGCLVEEEAPPDGDGPPLVHEGTTVGLRLPEVEFTDHTGQARSLRAIDADFTVLHIATPESMPFPPQLAQLRWVRAQLANVTVATVTLSNDPGATPQGMAALRAAMAADWDFGVPQGDLNYTLSLLQSPTVFVLDQDKVILARADEPLGQGRILEAVRATWGEGPDPGVGPEVGKRAPELVWRDIDGREGSLSGLNGSVVLIDVWQILCPWCIEQFVAMRELYANYSAQGLEVVSPDVVYWETDGEVRAIAEANNATWTFVVDGDNVQSRYKVLRVPSLFLVDREGVVRWTHVGYAPYGVLSLEVEKLI